MYTAFKIYLIVGEIVALIAIIGAHQQGIYLYGRYNLLGAFLLALCFTAVYPLLLFGGSYAKGSR